MWGDQGWGKRHVAVGCSKRFCFCLTNLFRMSVCIQLVGKTPETDVFVSVFKESKMMIWLTRWWQTNFHKISRRFPKCHRIFPVVEKQGEPENPKDKPDTRKPIFNVRLMLRVHFVIWVTISTWEPKRTSNGNLPPSLSRIRLSRIQLIRLLFLSNRHHTQKNRQNTQKWSCQFFFAQKMGLHF